MGGGGKIAKCHRVDGSLETESVKGLNSGHRRRKKPFVAARRGSTFSQVVVRPCQDGPTKSNRHLC